MTAGFRVREQKFICGKDYATADTMQVDFFEITEQQHKASTRKKKELASSIAKEAYNLRKSGRYLELLVQRNFHKSDYSVTYSWAKDGEKNLSPSFKVREFRCSDNTDPIFIDSELVEILQKIRNHFGKPVNITSGFRTASKNATIKNAAKFSQHLYGKAADIWISGVTVEQIAAYAETLLPNRGGIGRYPKEGHADRTHGWVHIDTRAAKSRWVS